MNSNDSKAKTFRRFIRIRGKLISKTFLRKADADLWYAEKRRQKDFLESGLVAPSEKVALADYTARWMQKRRAQGKPESSLRTDERRLRIHVLPIMGERILQEVSRKEWSEFLDQLIMNEKLSPATRNRVHALLRKLYNDAIRDELVTVNPLMGILKLRETHGKWDYWHTPSECALYLDKAQEEGAAFTLFATLALNTGARVGELLALDFEDIQIESRRIHIWKTFEQETKTICCRTKGHGDRWLGMNEAVVKALIRYRSQNASRNRARLLICDEDGKPLNEWQIRTIHARVCRRAGLKEIRVHDLRHTYASHYVMSGGSLSDVQALLGHSSPEMTRKYAHLTPGHLEAKASVVSFQGTKSPGESEDVSAVFQLLDFRPKLLTRQ